MKRIGLDGSSAPCGAAPDAHGDTGTHTEGSHGCCLTAAGARVLVVNRTRIGPFSSCHRAASIRALRDRRSRHPSSKLSLLRRRHGISDRLCGTVEGMDLAVVIPLRSRGALVRKLLQNRIAVTSTFASTAARSGRAGARRKRDEPPLPCTALSQHYWRLNLVVSFGSGLSWMSVPAVVAISRALVAPEAVRFLQGQHAVDPARTCSAAAWFFEVTRVMWYSRRDPCRFGPVVIHAHAAPKPTCLRACRARRSP